MQRMQSPERQQVSVILVYRYETRSSTGSNGKSGAGYDYGQVLGLSILFYEAQRSGVLPANNRVAWRANSAVNDVSPAGTDVSGGWYDAGGKFHIKNPLQRLSCAGGREALGKGL